MSAMSASAGPRGEAARPSSASRGPRINSTRSARSNTSRSSTSRGRRPTAGVAHERAKKVDHKELEEKYKALQQTREHEKRERVDEEKRKRREATAHQQLLTREHRAAEREFTRKEQEMAKLEKSLQKVRAEEDKRNDRQNGFISKMNETMRRLELRHKELEEELLEKVQEAAEAKGRLAHIEFAHLLQTQGGSNVSVRVERRVDYERLTNGEGQEDPMAIQPLMDQEMQLQAREESLRGEAEELRLLNQRKEQLNEHLRLRLEEYEDLTRADAAASSHSGMQRSISWQPQESTQEHPVHERVVHERAGHERVGESATANGSDSQPQAFMQEAIDDRTLDSADSAENWALGHTPPPADAVSITYPSGVTLYLPEFAPSMMQISLQNATQRERILQEIETGYHMQLLLRAAQVCHEVRNWDLNGGLSWESGEISTLVSMLFEDLGLVPPRDEQIFPIYSLFSEDRSSQLDMRDCFCVADATLRAVFLQSHPEAPESTNSYSGVGDAEAVGVIAATNGPISSYRSYEDLPQQRASTSGPSNDVGAEKKFLRVARSEPDLHATRLPSTAASIDQNSTDRPAGMWEASASIPPAPSQAIQAVAVESTLRSDSGSSASPPAALQKMPSQSPLPVRPASFTAPLPRPSPQQLRVSVSGGNSMTSPPRGSSIISVASSAPLSGAAGRVVSPPPALPAAASHRPPLVMPAPAASRSPSRLPTSSAAVPPSPARFQSAMQGRGDSSSYVPRIIRVPTLNNLMVDTPQRPAWLESPQKSAPQLPSWMADPSFSGPLMRQVQVPSNVVLPSSVPPPTPKVAPSPRAATASTRRDGSLTGPTLSPGRIVTSPLIVRRVSKLRSSSREESMRQQPQQRFAAPSASPAPSPAAGGATSSRTSGPPLISLMDMNSANGPIAQLGIDLNNDGKADFVITGPDSNRNGIPDAIDAAIAAANSPQVDPSQLSCLVVSVAPPTTTSGRDAIVTPPPAAPAVAPWAWGNHEALNTAAPPPMMPTTCICGNVFMPDAIFCRRCGAKRPIIPSMTTI